MSVSMLVSIVSPRFATSFWPNIGSSWSAVMGLLTTFNIGRGDLELPQASLHHIFLKKHVFFPCSAKKSLEDGRRRCSPFFPSVLPCFWCSWFFWSLGQWCRWWISPLKIPDLTLDPPSHTAGILSFPVPCWHVAWLLPCNLENLTLKPSEGDFSCYFLRNT